jgi:hypothetical protein
MLKLVFILLDLEFLEEIVGTYCSFQIYGSFSSGFLAVLAESLVLLMGKVYMGA